MYDIHHLVTRTRIGKVACASVSEMIIGDILIFNDNVRYTLVKIEQQTMISSKLHLKDQKTGEIWERVTRHNTYLPTVRAHEAYLEDLKAQKELTTEENIIGVLKRHGWLKLHEIHAFTLGHISFTDLIDTTRRLIEEGAIDRQGEEYMLTPSEEYELDLAQREEAQEEQQAQIFQSGYSKLSKIHDVTGRPLEMEITAASGSLIITIRGQQLAADNRSHITDPNELARLYFAKINHYIADGWKVEHSEDIYNMSETEEEDTIEAVLAGTDRSEEVIQEEAPDREAAKDYEVHFDLKAPHLGMSSDDVKVVISSETVAVFINGLQDGPADFNPWGIEALRKAAQEKIDQWALKGYRVINEWVKGEKAKTYSDELIKAMILSDIEDKGALSADQFEMPQEVSIQTVFRLTRELIAAGKLRVVGHHYMRPTMEYKETLEEQILNYLGRQEHQIGMYELQAEFQTDFYFLVNALKNLLDRGAIRQYAYTYKIDPSFLTPELVRGSILKIIRTSGPVSISTILHTLNLRDDPFDCEARSVVTVVRQMIDQGILIEKRLSSFQILIAVA
jgi:hypothetical protein